MSNDVPGHSNVLPPDLETARTLVRFGIRVMILTGFSMIGNHGFIGTLASFLVLAVLFCAGVAAIKRESPLGPALTHWDEAAAYGLIMSAVHMLNRGLAFLPGI